MLGRDAWSVWGGHRVRRAHREVAGAASFSIGRSPHVRDLQRRW